MIVATVGPGVQSNVHILLQIRLNVCTEGAHEVSCDCEQRIKQDIKFKFEEYQVLIKCSVYLMKT